MKKILLISMAIISPLLAINVRIPDPVFSPKGAEANKNIFVQNDTSEIKALEVYITHREHDLTGKETRIDADQEWEVFPSQLILKQKEERVVTLRYIASANIKKEIPYRVIVEEIPIDIGANTEESLEGSKINMILKFVKSIYVAPFGVKPDIKITQVKVSKKEDDIYFFDVILENKGTQHTLVKNGKCTFVQGEHTITIPFTHDNIPNINFLPGDKRNLSLQAPKEWKGSPDLPWEGSITLSQ